MGLFGTSGIRREFDRELVQLALDVGLAVGSVYRSAIVGCDTRTSSNALKYAAISGLLAGGASCSDAGVLPTPTLAYNARDFKAGVMITASHNPPNYNGIKLLNADGSAFFASQQKQIADLVAGTSLKIALWNKIKNAEVYSTAVERHIERIVKDFPGAFKLKVVVDSGCGAASYITPHLLTRMGCEVIPLNCHPSGFFPHDVEPTEANLRELMKAVPDSGADLGIAHDGDADRMMAVDDQGRFISGDKLLAIFARNLKARKIVTTIDASMSVDELGLKVVRTRVGDPYVSEELKRSGDFGGEPSGAWVFPGISLCPDGIYAAALVVAIASQGKLSELVDSIPSYPVLRGSIASDGVKLAGMDQRLEALNPLSISKVDGIKLSFKDGWLLIRPSGTEPKIRLTAEAKSERLARQLYNKGVKIIKESAGVITKRYS